MRLLAVLAGSIAGVSNLMQLQLYCCCSTYVHCLQQQVLMCQPCITLKLILNEHWFAMSPSIVEQRFVMVAAASITL